MSVKNLIISKIQSSNKPITKSQKLVADFMIKNVEKSTYMTANQIGTEAGVSETTVIRFALSLGYKSFSDLQEDFRERIITDQTVKRFQQANKEMGEKDTIASSFHLDSENLNKTYEQINRESFGKAIDLICQANKTCVIGFRSSSTDANYLGFSLHAMLGNVSTITSTGMEFEDCLRNSDEETVIIAISFSRYTAFVVEAIQYLKKEKNCKVITITDGIHSPLIAYSDEVFIVEVRSFTPINSHVASIALCNSFISSIGQKQTHRIENNLNSLEDYLRKINIFY